MDSSVEREATVRKSLIIQKGEILCSCPYGDSSYVAAGLSSGIINLFPCNGSKKVIKLNGHKGAITCLETCMKDPYLASGSVDGTVRLWVGNEQRDSTSIKLGETPISSIALSDKFDKLLVSSENTVSIWDPAHCSKIIDLEQHPNHISSVSLSSDGLVALTGSFDGTFRLFDLRSGTIANKLDIGNPITSTSIRQTGTAVACGCENGNVFLWDTRTQAFLNKDPLHHGAVTSIDFHPSKFLLLTASTDNLIGICDADNRNLYFTLKCHTAPINYARWSYDGTTFSTSGEDHRVVLWNEPIIRKTEPVMIKVPPKKRKIERLGKFNETLEQDPEPLPQSPIQASNTVNVGSNTGIKKYVAIMHKITDQIVALSKTMSALEAQMDSMDQQIAILEAEKRAQAKKAIAQANLD
ncbi:hypothetical protein TVAG_380150 [Trichomonas vaginalis G3]|uniref:Uncharacterized protein n=1 Tax=Trichomonas vaginalis (strain ATCC PRA-98 / G3) TaxID=412133 RepID=A2DXF3_TRIV3|nr:growth plate cartilage chondrocyte development protein family [Trichomonas vaginalis G3]EAY14905.1 hypothetical protein TVAG_380150 [Trichomonas vaginalis G3]KAI5485427.1 growth plate cartilage chondrocyte development protein family [Trichomonas vaginalis G3]|eukprot:XP_001327128.1 hypothetical protein [Trichomonas vaginalis G3]